MRIAKLIIFAIVLSTTTLVAQMKTGMVYGPNHVYSLTAPDGWVLDNTSAAGEGLHAVFYPEGSSWGGNIAAYTYFVTVPADLKLETFIKNDIEDFATRVDGKATQRADLTSTGGDLFKVCQYEYTSTTDKKTIYEYAGFVRAPTGIISVVITTKDQKLLKKYEAKFEQLVKSYLWIADHVEVKEGDE